MIAFRCSSERYLLVPIASSPGWMSNAAVEFLGEVDTDTFGPSVAWAIDFQVTTRGFAMVSKEQLYFSRPIAPIGMAPTHRHAELELDLVGT